jgi:diaminopimelate epimerase
MRFVKMHGIGNDYVYLDASTDPTIESRADLPALARAMSARHTGIGSDGLILVCRASGRAGGTPAPHLRMRIFNADGSEAEMCGNGVRGVAKFAHDRLGVRDNPMLVETGRGVVSIRYETEGGRLTRATVDMGEPILDLAKVPVDGEAVRRVGVPHEYEIDCPNATFRAVFVSMGNPHAVIFEEVRAGDRRTFAPASLRGLDLDRLGPQVENHPAFPRRINAHFVAILGRREAAMRSWERGAGATLACGTGACAVGVAGVRTGRLERRVTLHLPGGDLDVHWDEGSGHVLMTGPAVEVFEGEWPG